MQILIVFRQENWNCKNERKRTRETNKKSKHITANRRGLKRNVKISKKCLNLVWFWARKLKLKNEEIKNVNEKQTASKEERAAKNDKKC